MKQRGLGGFPHERLLNPEGATHSVGVVTQITATLRLPSTSLPRLRSAQVRASRSGWTGQYGLLDFSYKPSPFRAGLLTNLSSVQQQAIAHRTLQSYHLLTSKLLLFVSPVLVSQI